MVAIVEVHAPHGRELHPVDGRRVSIGAAEANDIVVSGDDTVSRLHAVLEAVADRWCLRDMSSRNGTFVNGERLWSDRPLVDGDEVRVGATRIVFRDPSGQSHTETGAVEPPPAVTAREREVLLVLCEPLLAGDAFTEPALTRQIAQCLFVSEAAVKQHLVNLYAKFGVDADDGAPSRRVRLANEAINRGAITVADLRGSG